MITIGIMVVLIIISELVSLRSKMNAGIYKPGEKIRTGLFTSVTARNPETYEDEWFDQDNPYRHHDFHAKRAKKPKIVTEKLKNSVTCSQRRQCIVRKRS